MSVQSASSPKLPETLEIQRHRIGSVVFLDGLNLTNPENVLKMVHDHFHTPLRYLHDLNKHLRGHAFFMFLLCVPPKSRKSKSLFIIIFFPTIKIRPRTNVSSIIMYPGSW